MIDLLVVHLSVHPTVCSLLSSKKTKSSPRFMYGFLILRFLVISQHSCYFLSKVAMYICVQNYNSLLVK